MNRKDSQKATNAELCYVVSAVGVWNCLNNRFGEVELDENMDRSSLLAMGAELHAKIHDLLGVYLRPDQLEYLWLTRDVYSRVHWSDTAAGEFKLVNANPLRLLSAPSSNPLCEVLYRMSYGTMHPMVLNANSGWSFRDSGITPDLEVNNGECPAAKISTAFLRTYAPGDLEKRGVVEVVVDSGYEQDVLRMEYHPDGVWYGLNRPVNPHILSKDLKQKYQDVDVTTLYEAILSLGFLDKACPTVTVKWSCDLGVKVPAGYGVVIPHDQINHYGAVRLK